MYIKIHFLGVYKQAGGHENTRGTRKYRGTRSCIRVHSMGVLDFFCWKGCNTLPKKSPAVLEYYVWWCFFHYLSLASLNGLTVIGRHGIPQNYLIATFSTKEGTLRWLLFCRVQYVLVPRISNEKKQNPQICGNAVFNATTRGKMLCLVPQVVALIIFLPGHFCS